MRKLLLLTLLSVVFVSCSKDEENNPVVQDPAYVGAYQGTTSQGKDISFTIGNVNGAAYVTGYSITYTYPFGSSTATATKAQTDSKGLVPVTGTAFAISLSADANDKIAGTFTNATTLTGLFNIDTGLTQNGAKIYGAGTFTITKK